MIKPLKVLGIVGGVIAAGAAAGTAILLKKWSDDPEATDLRVVLMNGKGVRLTKDENGNISVDTRYNANEDEAIRGDFTGPVPVVDVPERVRAFADEAGADAKAAAEIVADKAGELTSQLKEKYGDTAEELKEKAEDKLGQLREKAGDAVDQLKEKTQVCCDGLKNIANLAREQAESWFAAAEDTAQEGKDLVQDGICECAGKAEEAADKAADCCCRAAEKTGEDLEDLMEAAKDAAKEAADRILPEE